MRKAALLRQSFSEKPILRIVGAHNGLGAKLIEKNNFDGVWASGLEISATHALPDANILTMTENLNAAQAINEATALPVICDCDTGYGNAANVMHMVKKYEAADLAAVIIEDKKFPKINSFMPHRQELDSVDEFAGKIEAAKSAQRNSDFMVFARLEALIAGLGMNEAVHRAHAYADAGADGIVIHSKMNSPEEVFQFSKLWKNKLPLVAIPTTYFQVPIDEFRRNDFKMVIYANQGLRASIRAMDETFKSIYQTGSTASVEEKIVSLEEVFEMQGMKNHEQKEKQFSRRGSIQVVIPAASDNKSQPKLAELLKDKPLCMLDIAGKAILQRQLDIFRSMGMSDIHVIGGYRHEKIKIPGVKVITNQDYSSSQSAYSIMCAQDRFGSKTLITYSDILFDRSIVERLIESPHTITIVIDRAYQSLPARDKKYDLVIAEDQNQNGQHRRLDVGRFKLVKTIGKNLDKSAANHEFIGMAFIQEDGILQLKKAWKDAQSQFVGKPFYEAISTHEASFTDVIQHLIDKGVAVYGLEIECGWSEIHSIDDYQRLTEHFQSPALIQN